MEFVKFIILKKFFGSVQLGKASAGCQQVVAWQSKLGAPGFFVLFVLGNFSVADMTLNDGHASPAGLEVCLCCKKGVKGNEAGLECDLCHYWFHTKCEGVGADVYKALQKFEEAVRVGRANSAIKWYCDSCARTVEKVNGRLLKLEVGHARLMDEVEKLKEKMIEETRKLREELEEKLSGHKDEGRAGGEEPQGSSSKLLPVPLKQEITEALDIEKRKDLVVIRGIQESEDMDEKVGMIMKELGFSKQYQVMGRIGMLRKRAKMQTLVGIDL